MTATTSVASTGVLATLKATPASVRFLLGGVLVNQLGAFVQTFLVLYLTAGGFSAGHAGASLTTFSAGAIVGTLVGGELTHRLGARSTIIASMATSAAVLTVVPFLATPDRFPLLLVAVGVVGLSTQCQRPAAAVLLSELMPAERRVMAFSMMRIALNVGGAVAPLIAAGLILVDWDLLWWFDATTAIAYAALALVWLPGGRPAASGERPADGGEPVGDVEDKRSAYAAMARDTRYWAFLASGLLGAAIYVQSMVALPLKITADGHPAALYSVVLALSAVLLIVCELKITSYVQHWRPQVAGVVGTVVMSVAIAGYGVAAGPASEVVIVACATLFVFGIMINGPTMFAHPASFPVAVRARYIAAHQATFGVGLALGPTVGVLGWQALGDAVWPVLGGAGLLAAWCAYVGLGRRAPAPEPASGPASQPASGPARESAAESAST